MNIVEEYDEPPPSLDTSTRIISSVSVFLRQVFRYINRVDFVCPIPGTGIRRRNFNLQNI